MEELAALEKLVAAEEAEAKPGVSEEYVKAKAAEAAKLLRAAICEHLTAIGEVEYQAFRWLVRYNLSTGKVDS